MSRTLERGGSSPSMPEPYRRASSQQEDGCEESGQRQDDGVGQRIHSIRT